MGDFPPEKDRVERLSEAEIMALFESYGFRDPEGHTLTKCLDFQILVKRAVGHGE